MSDFEIPDTWEVTERESDGLWFGEHRDAGGPINSRQSGSSREDLAFKIQAWESGQNVTVEPEDEVVSADEPPVKKKTARKKAPAKKKATTASAPAVAATEDANAPGGISTEGATT